VQSNLAVVATWWWTPL